MTRISAVDLTWMEQAVALARRGEGLTRPNPPVGAVLVKNGHRIGTGWHRRAGGPHAEIYALRQAGPQARGATLYVTLEPCSTQGRTPPCIEAILQAGIQRVVIAAIDPNPLHAGRGVRLLRRGGIQVAVGACAQEAADLIAPFACYVQHNRPYITLKLGLSLDGRIADHTHSSRWITGPDARGVVQAMRRASDAILVGAGTVRHDNPSLWPRPDRQRQPWRIIAVQSGSLPLSAQVFNDPHADRTIVAVPKGWRPATAQKLRRKGVQVWELPRTRYFSALARELGRLGVLRVLCEGGGILAGELIQAGLTDALCVFLSPMLIGGPVGATGHRQWRLKQAPRFEIKQVQAVGKDLLLRMAPSPGED
ncbi:MAG: bifunctional diaminohydroxyphosphoribosylaminopyrimidine deaminase/5-amino-6-(5-phosphoribosylamino)uracil reductase RibD [Kiritimatiellae bacterium]|nr:bifunctional diaminohydroxyphosphoribosylaminopyrimidine deaminase/5-amino-6-(5-phosphoribosylamino)uracil reductase RibD [Kiritimatiellia bacterium]MDD4340624.1 bifunctional diaminohydroxyphosphoribosylaminopyrimidine deaminase/5-amino-6-(5-phosphoribosylamino)uracil reductase RibD [Kiritimatiellia bacterium]